MVERAHTATDDDNGFWPHVMGTARQMGHRIADFFAPAADGATTRDCYEIDIELPGVAADAVKVELHGGALLVSGTKQSERENVDKKFFFRERRFGLFQRSFRLPEDVDASSITADYKDGVLSLKLPKSVAKRSTPTEIRVQAS